MPPTLHEMPKLTKFLPCLALPCLALPCLALPKPNGARKGQIRTERPALLKGLIFTTDGRAMRGRRLYRYYLSTRDAKEGHGASGVRMLPAGEIEEAVVAQLRSILRAPEMVTHVWREIAKRGDAATNGMTEMQVAVALYQIDTVWEQLFPLEQHRIVLLVERIVVSPNEMQVRLHPNGVENLALDVVRSARRLSDLGRRKRKSAPARPVFAGFAGP